MARFSTIIFVLVFVAVSIYIGILPGIASHANSEQYRPQYHFTAPDEWIGDPNGLIYHDGQYHLFTWRHAISEDLVYWKHLPRALHGAWSGSVVIDKNNSSGIGSYNNPAWVAIFTRPDTTTHVQAQHIAYSLDGGINWTSYYGNPVLDIGSTEFRDPQVFWYAPNERWIMVVALAAEQKVSIYASENIVDWEDLSDFGPAGAISGVWECPDLFPLPIDGDTTNIKWVMQVDVQPVGGQYFLGDFDGTVFTADIEFDKIIEQTIQIPQGVLYDDFERGDHGDWVVTGDAFGSGPSKGTLPNQHPVKRFIGERLINSYHGGDRSQGTMLSPTFTVRHDYINFLIGGGDHPGKVGIGLIIYDEVVRSTTGNNSEHLDWSVWDVREYIGRQAHLKIYDHHTGGWGHILVDHIIMGDEPAKRIRRENAFWIDYGNDFYATRSWRNTPNENKFRKWVAWMSNWQYAHAVPTYPWKGVWSLPREIRLRTFAEGVRLTQKPVEGFRNLRKEQISVSERIIEGNLDLSAEYGIRGTEFEMVIEFYNIYADTVGVKVRCGAEQETIIRYIKEEKVVELDRRKSGNVEFSSVFPNVNAGPHRSNGGSVHFHIFVDRSTVEVFTDDGRLTLSNLIFPDIESDGIVVFSNGGTSAVKGTRIWEMESIISMKTK